MTRGIKAAIASASALALATFAPLGAAVAQEGDAVITNTETVNVSLDPSGNVDVARVYDQIAIQGSGTVDYANPVSTVGLRNLDSFGGFTVEDDSIVEETSVDGQLRRRAVSDFDLDLPVTVSAVYRLDGNEISPDDLVGRSGELEVVYTITNTTGSEEQITLTDGQGNTVTQTAMVYDPFAGSMSFTLPSNFTDVVSDSGFVPAGDGRGGTLMNLSVTLISGLTEQVVEAGYTAQVTDAVVPPATLSVVPVVVEENPSSAAQLEALRGGAETGQELASNAVLLDENVLALADGAATLVSGIFLLNEGAAELSDGLVNTAAPGSAELAAGADELAAGLNETAVPGSQELAAGAGELAAGLTGTAAPGSVTLSSGADQVADGLDSLDAGLAQLSAAVDGLPKSIQDELAKNADYQQLLAALQGIIDGIGTKPTGPVADPKTLNEALTNLEFGLDNPNCNKADPENQANPCGFKQVTEILSLQLDNPSGSPEPGAKQALEQIIAALGTTPAGAVPALPFGGVQTMLDYIFSDLGCTFTGSPATSSCTAIADPGKAVNTALRLAASRSIIGGPVPAGSTSALDGLAAIIAKVGDESTPNTAMYALAGLRAGIGSPSDFPGVEDTLYYGLEGIRFNLTNPKCDKSDPQNKNNPCGISEVLQIVKAGVPQLVDTLVDGIQEQLQAALGSPTAGCDPTATLRCASAALVDGSGQVADGAGDLAAGLAGAADGSEQLADGAGQLATGLVGAGDGSNQLADGAGQLADGLGDAADGSVQLSEGLSDAAEAAPALPDGARRISAEGTSLLIEAGDDTALSFGERVAVLEASAERTVDGGLPFGGPQGAIVAAAYRYDLAAATGATAQNTGRLVAGVAIAGAAAIGAVVLARRRTA